MLRVLPVLIILATVIYLVVRLVQGRADGGGSRGNRRPSHPTTIRLSCAISTTSCGVSVETKPDPSSWWPTRPRTSAVRRRRCSRRCS